MTTSDNARDYLKAIYAILLDRDSVPTTELAALLNVSPATCSNMLRRLKRQGLCDHTPYKGATLTEKGRKEALRLVRVHRLWELYLTRHMQIPWDQVHEIADQLEHATNEALADRISEILGHPTTDPHGDPIPSKEGVVREPPRDRLADMPPGQRGVVIQCMDEGAEILEYLRNVGIAPQVHFSIIAVDPFGGSFTLEVGGRTVRISQAVASTIMAQRSH